MASSPRMTNATGTSWAFYRVALLVTGETEELHLPALFRNFAATGRCAFTVIRRVPQLNPLTSVRREKVRLRSGKTLTSRDEELGLAVRRALNTGFDLVLVVDDLERRHLEPAYTRYRSALDTMLCTEEQRSRVSVHFLVNMLEAYYFADTSAVNRALGTQLEDHPDDVETIPHPKNELKKLHPAFREKEHGGAILSMLNVQHVLSHPSKCLGLRTLFAWLVRAMRLDVGSALCLTEGALSPTTRAQIDALR